MVMEQASLTNTDNMAYCRPLCLSFWRSSNKLEASKFGLKEAAVVIHCNNNLMDMFNLLIIEDKATLNLTSGC